MLNIFIYDYFHQFAYSLIRISINNMPCLIQTDMSIYINKKVNNVKMIYENKTDFCNITFLYTELLALFKTTILAFG